MILRVSGLESIVRTNPGHQHMDRRTNRHVTVSRINLNRSRSCHLVTTHPSDDNGYVNETLVIYFVPVSRYQTTSIQTFPSWWSFGLCQCCVRSARSIKSSRRGVHLVLCPINAVHTELGPCRGGPMLPACSMPKERRGYSKRLLPGCLLYMQFADPIRQRSVW